jgi:hypothetical protein
MIVPLISSSCYGISWDGKEYQFTFEERNKNGHKIFERDKTFPKDAFTVLLISQCLCYPSMSPAIVCHRRLTH